VEGGEEKINLKSLRGGGNRSQGHGTRREFEREKVKREQCGKECSKEMRGCWRSRVGGNCENLCSRERP